MNPDSPPLTGTATVVQTPDGPVWKLIWKGVEMDEYQVLKFNAEDYPPGTIVLIHKP